MLIRQALKYVLARGLSAVINFAALAVFTRLLSPTEYGQFALVLAAVSLANTVLFQWVRLGLLRFAAAHEADRTGLASTVMLAYGRTAVAAAILGAIAWLVAPPVITRPLVLLAIGILLAQAWFELNLDAASSRLDPRRYGYLSQTRAVLGLAAGSLLVASGLGASGALGGVLIGFAVAPLLFGRVHWRGASPATAEPEILRQFLAYGVPLTAVYALDFVVSTSDRFLLKAFQDSAAAGLYAAAYDLTQQSLGMVMMIVNLAAFPMAVRALESGGRTEAEPQLRQHATLLLAVALPATLMFVLLRKDLADTLLGVEFRPEATGLIPVVALAAFLGGMKAFYFDLSFQLGRATRSLVTVVGAAAITNFLLNLWWIPWLGLMGAGYATVAAYAVGLGLSWWLGRRAFPLPIPWGEWGRIVLATGSTGLVVAVVRGPSGIAGLLLRTGMGGAAYVLMTLALDVGGSRQWLLARGRGTSG